MYLDEKHECPVLAKKKGI